MKATVIVLSSLAIVFGATPVWAQQDSSPYEGVVTGSNVYVRSGPNMGSYPVAKLSAPQRVKVVEKLSDDWLAIQPVRGCFGVISARYVQPDATGRIGTITGDGVLVRAAGKLRQKNFDNPLGKRNRGDRVRIVGRVRDTEGNVVWYVIKPPSDLRFYISARFVRSADGTTPPPPSDETPTTPAAVTPSTPPVQAAVGAPVRQELDALRAIRTLEKRIVAEATKPVAQRNFKEILARAEEIKLPPNSRFTPIYDSLMQYLREETALVEKSRAVNRMVENVLREAEKKRAAVDKPAAETTPKKTPPDGAYDLQGVLTVSALYTLADPKQPKRYVVRHPRTKSIVGYAQSSGGKAALEDYEGRNVGLRGRETYDESIAMKILEVDAVTPLDASAAPAKPKPAEPEPAEAKPAEPVAPEPMQPAEEPRPLETEQFEPAPIEPVEPESATPIEPEPAAVELIEPVEPEPAPMEPVEPEPAAVEFIEPVEPEPAAVELIEPVEPEPAPMEPAEPEPAPMEPAEPEPAPMEPVEPESATPIEPEPAAVELIEPVEPEPAAVELIEPVEPVEPEPAQTEAVGPKPVKRKPAAPEPAAEKPAEPEPAEPIKPAVTEPGEIEPMEIQPLDVEPMEVESPEVKKLPSQPVKTPPTPVQTTEPMPMPAEQAPAPEPEAKMFEVETTEGDVEVEWD